MRILLISPPALYMIPTEMPALINETRGYLPPLGLLYLASYLKKHTEHQVSVLDAQVENLDYAQMELRIKEESPQIVGVQTQTFSLIDALKTAELVKKIDHSITVIMGGPHASIYPKETISFPFVDLVVKGEGEMVLFEIIERIENNNSMEGLSSVSYKKEGVPVINEQEALIEKLDSLPFPDRTLTPYRRYYSVLSRHFPVTTMITSRGCPYACVFCHESGKLYRAASADYVLSEIEYCLSLGIKEIFIHDDTFTVDKQRVRKICEAILSRGMCFRWDARARVDTVDKPLLTLMKQAGCQRLSFGLESGDSAVLSRLAKGITLEEARQVFRYCHELNITTLADFMIGSPGETQEEIKKTILFSKEIKPDFVQFSLLTPYPATKLYAEGIKSGIIPYDTWGRYAREAPLDFVPQLWEGRVSRQELQQWIKIAYKTHYLTVQALIGNLRRVCSLRDFMYKFQALCKLIRL